MRRRLFEIVEEGAGTDAFSRYFDTFILLLIGLSVIAVMLESVEPVEAQFGRLLWWFELFSIGVFTLEYGLRLYTAPEKQGYEHPVLGRLSYMLTPLLLVDLFAVLPFYLPFVLVDLRFLRVLRLVRLVRIVKVTRYVKTIRRMTNVFYAKKEELAMSFVLASMMLVVASSLMYYIEHPVQPEVFSSIPATMWWAVVTLTTVGYGDVVPVTVLGKILTGLIAMVGIAMFALPAGIIASGFEQELEREKQQEGVCSKCGQPLPGERDHP
jgi:voltage-gated potassium channel